MTAGDAAGKPAAARARAQVGTLRAAILRWNRQFNLVSRDGTPERLDNLVRQCQRGAVQIWDDLASDRRESFTYIDLGSGGGLPALVWLPWFRAWGHRGRAWLVEPREKRAWFLERTARAQDLEGVTVVAHRWGEGDLGPNPEASERPTPAGDILISLKALRLTDATILAGLDAVLARWATSPEGPTTATIVRFLGREGATGAVVARDVPGTRKRWRPVELCDREAPGLRLSVHRYRRV